MATRVGSRSRRRVARPRAPQDETRTRLPVLRFRRRGVLVVSASSSSKEKKRRKGTGEVLSGLWNELKYVSLRDDPTPEAADLLATIEASKARPKPGERWDDKRWREQEEAAASRREGGATGAPSGTRWRTATRCATRRAHVLRGERGHRGRVAAFGATAHALQAVGGFDELAAFFGCRARSSAGTWTSSKT